MKTLIKRFNMFLLRRLLWSLSSEDLQSLPVNGSAAAHALALNDCGMWSCGGVKSDDMARIVVKVALS